METLRYAVVGLGWIAQESILPAFQNAQSSVLAALVSSDIAKADELGKQYSVSRTCTYAQYDELLASGAIDAVYIGLPNSMHGDFAARAARAGIHILCEKPMASTAEECETMIHIAARNRIRLMVAYRLHFEPANLKAIEIIRDGIIGEPRFFSSVFSQQVEPGNIRLKRDLGGGPLMDLGVYPVNAARYLFGTEPIEVSAIGGSSEDSRFDEVHEMASAILRFPGDRLASFTSSMGASPSDHYEVIGTKGSLRLTPAFSYHQPKTLKVTRDGETRAQHFDRIDQFGAELDYFTRCVLNHEEPEPSGQEGWADLRVVDALLRSMRSRKTVRLEPFERGTRPTRRQEYEMPPVEAEEIVHAHPPSK
ncbi:Gfo/Idh/MocA family protein [Bryobacter aggregatus]|uniref:Gfo/Idh/MocA family protein n=1 Tax=Bryobacter aggregatus TaxID=360054 RepID=UPI0004E0E1C0|nr:Gfo/Idh/MocA family oxidoreductase [Bryobacter aggregatus]